MNNQSQTGKNKEVDIVFKLFHGQKLTKKEYDWIGSKLRNGKQEVPANSRNINGK